MEPTRQQIEAEAFRRGYEQGWDDFNQKHMADMRELYKFYKDKSMLKKEKRMSKTMGVSPITDIIYYGTVKDNMWQNDRKDVTDIAIKAVFEWFMHKVDDLDDGQNCYEIQFEGLSYKLQMVKE